MRVKYVFVPLPDTAMPFTHRLVRNEFSKILAADKQYRKEKSAAAVTQLRLDLKDVIGNKVAVHQLLHGYEQAHLVGGGDIEFISEIRKLFSNPVLRFAKVDGMHSNDCFVTVEGVEKKIGTLAVEEERFTRIDVPEITLNDVFVRKGEAAPRHYVGLTTSQIHVRRFVTRALSAMDAMDITIGRALVSARDTDNAQQADIASPNNFGQQNKRHDLALNAPMSVDQQILSHTRGWNKRFISTGVSNRDVFSTRGTVFKSMYGTVVVDLAQVPLDSVYDIHRPDTASGRLGLSADEILHNNWNLGGRKDLDEQKYLAMRDVIRTRELLVKRSIPLNALRYVARGNVLLGVGSTYPQEHDEAPQLIKNLDMGLAIEGEDHLEYVTRDLLRWHIVEFKSSLGREEAFKKLSRKLGGPTLVRFNKYGPQRPAGMC